MSRDDTKRAIGKVVSVSADRFVIEMHSGTDSFTVVVRRDGTIESANRL